MNRLIRWPLVLMLGVALVGVAGCGGGGSGGADNSKGTDTDLIVQQVLPTNGQEVASDLIDVGGEITIRFSATLASGTVLGQEDADCHVCHEDVGMFEGLDDPARLVVTILRVPGDANLGGRLSFGLARNRRRRSEQGTDQQDPACSTTV